MISTRHTLRKHELVYPVVRFDSDCHGSVESAASTAS
jgi:hypothetical protein